MVDTKDSKSFVSDGVRVQVSSPVSKLSRWTGKLFYLTNALCVRDLNSRSVTLALSRLSDNPKMTLVTIQEPGMRRACAGLWLPACERLLFFVIRQGRRLYGRF